MKKPIVFFDLESTSAEIATAKIIEFAALKVHDDGTQEELTMLIDPGIPITNSDIHNITDEMVKGAGLFSQHAEKIRDFMDGCDLSGYNIKRFDIPLLAEEMARVNMPWGTSGRKIVDPFILYKLLNSQSLKAAYKCYTGEEINDAHRAMSDVKASYEVLKGMISKGHVPPDRDEIIKFQQNGEEFDPTVDYAGKFVRTKEGTIIFNFGKHRGQPVTSEPGFLQWMVGKDFTSDTLKWVDAFLDNDGQLPF